MDLSRYIPSIDEIELSFKAQGDNCEQIIPGVLLVHDFATPEDISVMENIIAAQTEDDWKKEYYENLKRFCMAKFGRDDVEKLVEEGKFEITYNWEDKIIPMHPHKVAQDLTTKLKKRFEQWPYVEVLGFGTMQRQQPGVPLKKHTDVHTDPSIIYASILYVNDEYNDGEIFWAKKNFKLKPRKGSLLIFSGEDEFEHGVVAVGEGPIRYVLPGFIHKLRFYQENRF